MKETLKLNSDILNISMQIAKLFPELSKYIAEMPVKISYAVDSEMNIKYLTDYYDSLYALLKEYALYHGNTERQLLLTD